MFVRQRAGERDGRRRQADDVGSFMTWRNIPRQWKKMQNDSLIFSCYWTKVHENLGRRRGPLVVSSAVSQMSLNEFHARDIRTQNCHQVVKSWKTGPVFGPQFLRRVGPKNLLRQLVTMVYPLLCGKVWWSSVGSTACAKPHIEGKRRFFEERVKMMVLFLAV